MALFDLNKIKNTQPVSAEGQATDKDARLSMRFLADHYQRIESVKALVGQVPEQGECLFLWTDKSFNAFTFVPYLIKERGKIDELTLSTYSINKRILLSFMRLVEAGQIGKMYLLVADSLKHQRPVVTDLLDSFAHSRPQLQVKYAWNHSKIMLAKCGDDHLIVEGSGNWSENSRHEQYLFANSKQLYGFRESCIKTVQDK